MTDRELLEKAAKAAGVVFVGPVEKFIAQIEDRHKGGFIVRNERGGDSCWNPLTDDGDALRLAVRLNIPVIPYDDETSTGTVGVVAKNWGSKEANTRRAIVRAAAAMAED